ncbi:peroxisomal membrane protein 11A [Nerophis lumbriciformis]|uniref:peroxisomal membrane protein 11A n=1 Tax=Nerophis lumbriciformis TaxID=546530 RepID=UPI002ADFAFFB|nr:peroxisomal membrane protein 11A-like [Nerophis lumbriciformis]
MDVLINVINQSQGRDRIFRATQYACALCAHVLRNNCEQKDLVDKLKSLEANLSAGRKLLRLGNAVSAIEAAKRAVRLSDRVLCLCLTTANINRALYFIFDNALWARNAGLVRGIDKERWSANASRCYLLSLITSLTRDVYVISQLMVHRARDQHFRQKMDAHLNQSPEVVDVIIPQLDAFLFLLLHSLKSQPSVFLDTIKNVCDLSLPLDKLGIYKSNNGVVAFCGLVSSLIGIVTLIHPKLRIQP